MEKIKLIGICDRVILFSLYAVAFFLPISKAIIEILSILAIICFIIKKTVLRQGLIKTKANLSIYLYLTICFISIFLSSNFKISSRTFFAKTLQDILFFFALVETLNSKNRIKNIIYILLCSSLLIGIDGIYQHFTHKDFIRNRPYYGLPRIHATFPTPNDFGSYLITIIPFSLAFFFIKLKARQIRLFFVSLFLLLFICLLLTVSRGAWLAFIGSMLFMSIWIRYLGVILVVIGMIIIFTRQFYYPFLKERLGSIFIFADHSSMDRRIIWETAWNMFKHRPWIGLGLGTFMFNFSKFVSGNYPYGVPYAHNCFLQMASEIGIIGLLSFLLILVLLFSDGIKVLYNHEKTFSWFILLASLTAVLGYCIQMATDTIFYSLDLGMLFWLLVGLGISSSRILENEVVRNG